MSALLTSTDVLTRTTNLIAGSSDYSVAFWFRLNNDGGPGTYQSLFTREDNTPSPFTAYIQIYTEDVGAGPVLNVSFSNNVTAPILAGPAINVGQWYHCALVKIGSQFRLYVNGTFIDSETISFSAITFDTEYIGYDTFATNDFNIMAWREWSNDLTATQVLNEAKSSVVKTTASLEANTPLVSDADDISGNNNDWTNTGVTFVADTAYPSANIDFENAIDVGDLSVAYQQIVDANPSGEFAFDLWWKITIPADLIIFSIFGRSANYLANRCDVDFWETPGTTSGSSTSSEDNYPILTPTLVQSDLHYISAVPSSRTADPYVVTMDMEAPTSADYQTGDILNNDDQPDRPAAILSSVTDYLVRKYVNLPSGESGDIILNGNFLLGDRYAPNMKLYDEFFNLLAEFTGSHGGNHSRGIRSNRATSKIYFVQNGSSGLGAIIDVIEGTSIVNTFSLTDGTGSSRGAIMPNLADTVLYHANNSTANVITGWDISGNASLGTIVAGVVGERLIDMLALADGSFAVLRLRTSDDEARVYHYNSSWVLNNVWNVGESNYFGVPPRMSWGLDDPVSVWVKRIYADPLVDGVKTTFDNVRLSDGVIIGSVDHATFFDGAYTPDLFDGTSPLALFGAPSSCPFFLFPSGETPEPPTPDKSGLYFVNPDKPDFNDSFYGDIDAKIPNPTVRTALFGE